MTALEIRMARSIAEDHSIDLSKVNDGVLYGFGLSDFTPVTVPLRAVAKCMRWQCQQWDGGWDEKQFSEDVPCYRRNVTLADLTDTDCERILVAYCQRRLAGPVWLKAA